MINDTSAVAWIAGTALVVFVAATYTLESANLLLGGTVVPSIVVLSAFLSALVVCISLSTAPRDRRLHLAVSVGLLLIVVVFASIWLALRFDDVSSDGQEYHQSAVLLLADGWNPGTRGC